MRHNLRVVGSKTAKEHADDLDAQIVEAEITQWCLEGKVEVAKHKVKQLKELKARLLRSKN